MTSTNLITTIPFAGSRLKTCCGKLVGCACRRSNQDIVNGPSHFSGNSFLSQSGIVFCSFRKCGVSASKVKCLDNRMVLPSNNVKCSVNDRNYVVLTDSDLDCGSLNVVYLVSCRVCSVQYVGETSRPANVRWYEHLYKIRKNDRSQLS